MGAVEKKGFTLMELLVVVALIAIVASGAIMAYNGVQKNSAESMSISTQKEVLTVISSYATLHDGKVGNGFDSLLRAGCGATAFTSNGGVTAPTYGGGWTTITGTGGKTATLATAPLQLFYIGKDVNNDGIPDDGIVNADGVATDHWGLWSTATNCAITTATTGTGNGLSDTGSGAAFHSLVVSQLTANDVKALATLGITYVNDASSVENRFHGDAVFVKRALVAGDPVVVVDPLPSRTGGDIYRQLGVDLGDPCVSGGTATYPRATGTGNNDGLNLTQAGQAQALVTARFIVLGIGKNCTLMGDRQGGLQGEPPLSGIVKDGEYNKFLLVLKVTSGANDMDPYPVMVLDPRGQPPTGNTAGGARGWASRTN